MHIYIYVYIYAGSLGSEPTLRTLLHCSVCVFHSRSATITNSNTRKYFQGLCITWLRCQVPTMLVITQDDAGAAGEGPSAEVEPVASPQPTASEVRAKEEIKSEEQAYRNVSVCILVCVILQAWVYRGYAVHAIPYWDPFGTKLCFVGVTVYSSTSQACSRSLTVPQGFSGSLKSCRGLSGLFKVAQGCSRSLRATQGRSW